VYNRAAHGPSVRTPSTYPGSLILHGDHTVAGCTEDEEPERCRGLELRHEGDPKNYWLVYEDGRACCGIVT